MKYLFILGRNLELSRLEVLEYLKRTENLILNEKLRGNGLYVEVNKELTDNAIDSLGGVLRIGKVLSEIENLDKIMIYAGEKNNINYVLWDFSDKTSEVKDYLKTRFRKERVKGVYKGLTERVKSQRGEDFFIPSSKLVDEEYFVFDNYFGKIIQICDYSSIEKRDMEKPVRRSSLAISPRLAKIMINLSGIKQGKVIDAFCGIGTLLSEALLQGLEVIGVDRDKKAILDSEKNLKWFGFDSERSILINFDSRKVNIPECSVMISEPDLGETLKKTPPKSLAQKILNQFELLMISVINNLKQKIQGRIVFTSPLIRIGKKRLGCDIENICSKTGYKLTFDSIDEYREGQIVGRRIFVLEKS